MNKANCNNRKLLHKIILKIQTKWKQNELQVDTFLLQNVEIPEIWASQIALDGTISYFPSPAENKIYAKYIDMQGLPVFLTYELQRNVVPVQPQYVDNSAFASLQSRVEAIEKALKGDVASEPTTNANANYAQ